MVCSLKAILAQEASGDLRWKGNKYGTGSSKLVRGQIRDCECNLGNRRQEQSVDEGRKY